MIDIKPVRQKEGWDCGPASVMALCRFFGVGPDQEQDYIQALHTTKEDGTNPEAIIAYLSSVGLSCNARSDLTLPDLARLTNGNSPVLCAIQDYEDDAQQLINMDSGHWVVVCGLENDKVRLADPSAGIVDMPALEFLGRWEDKGDEALIHYGIAISKAEPIHNSMKKLVECKSVPCHLPEAIARKVDELTKGNHIPYQRKAVSLAGVQFEPGERAEVSIITTATVDKSNEVVLPNGLRLDTFSGTVFYNHDYTQIVGNCPWVKHYDKDNSIRAKTVYFENQEQAPSNWYAFVDEVWTMVKAGALKAKSIGFQPLSDKREPTAEELQEYPDWAGAGVWDSGLLLEYSVCPIGVCNEALVELINQKSLTAEKAIALGFEFSISKHIRKEGDKWVLYSQDMSKILGKHDSKEEAEKQEAAIEAAKHAKRYKPKRKPKPTPELVLAKALDAMDVDRIIALAKQQYRLRGRV